MFGIDDNEIQTDRAKYPGRMTAGQFDESSA